MRKIKKADSVPLYLQIEELIREQISKGILKPGSPLPSEKELQQKYNISRTTIRQAMGNLVQDGIIIRQQGKGTYVNKKKRVQPNLSLLNSFSEELLREGKTPGSSVLKLSVIKSPQHIANYLNLNKGDSVIFYERMRTSDGIPVAIHTVYLDPEKLSGLQIKDLNQENVSLYRIIEDKLGLRIGHADEILKAILADERIAQALGIDIGSPIMSLERITSTVDNKPFEYAKIFARGDEFQYKARLSRSENTLYS